MRDFLYALPILLIVFGMPAILIFGYGLQAYREHQKKKYLKEHAQELEDLEKEYQKIIDAGKK